MFHVVGASEYARIPHAFHSVLLLPYTFLGIRVSLSPGPSVVQFSSGTLPTWKCALGSLVFEVSTKLCKIP